MKRVDKDFKQLGRQLILLWHGECIDISKKQLDELLKKAGYPYGVSEDSYFDLEEKP